MSYTFLEGIAIADIAFEARGESLEQLFESCGKAFTHTMVNRLESIEPKEERSISISADNEEKLLYSFLDELIFLKDTEQLLFSEFSLNIRKKQKLLLVGKVKGEKIDPKKHEPLAEVKAISWHMFKVEKKDGWRAVVILDV
jgi:SHS2 domain-containing protein